MDRRAGYVHGIGYVRDGASAVLLDIIEDDEEGEGDVLAAEYLYRAIIELSERFCFVFMALSSTVLIFEDFLCIHIVQTDRCVRHGLCQCFQSLFTLFHSTGGRVRQRYCRSFHEKCVPTKRAGKIPASQHTSNPLHGISLCCFW